jgi:hypothetical protein
MTLIDFRIRIRIENEDVYESLTSTQHKEIESGFEDYAIGVICAKYGIKNDPETPVKVNSHVHASDMSACQPDVDIATDGES